MLSREILTQFFLILCQYHLQWNETVIFGSSENKHLPSINNNNFEILLFELFNTISSDNRRVCFWITKKLRKTLKKSKLKKNISITWVEVRAVREASILDISHTAKEYNLLLSLDQCLAPCDLRANWIAQTMLLTHLYNDQDQTNISIT